MLSVVDFGHSLSLEITFSVWIHLGFALVDRIRFLQNHTVSVSETNVTSIEILYHEFVDAVFMFFCFCPLFGSREKRKNGEEKEWKFWILCRRKE